MSANWLLRTGIVVLLGFAAAAPARAAMPDRELTKLEEPDETFTSPDGQVIIEQYSRKKDEYDHVYEFWAFDAKHEHGVLLNDTKTDKFSIPPDLAKNNAETINYPEPRRK